MQEERGVDHLSKYRNLPNFFYIVGLLCPSPLIRILCHPSGVNNHRNIAMSTKFCFTFLGAIVPIPKANVCFCQT